MDCGRFFTQISGRNFLPELLERSILRLPLSKLCAVPFALPNRALFEGERRVKRCREKGRKRGGQQRGKKEKRTHENRSVPLRLKLPFVQIHGGNHSNIIVLCICICYKSQIISKVFVICYAAPSKLQKTAVSASATKYLFKYMFCLYLYLL